MSGKKFFLITLLSLGILATSLAYALSIPQNVVSNIKNEKTTQQTLQNLDITQNFSTNNSNSISTFQIQTDAQTVNDIIYGSYKYSKEQLDMFKKEHIYAVGKTNLFLQTVKDKSKIIKSSIYPSDTPDEDTNNTSTTQQNTSPMKSGENHSVQNK